MAGDTHMMHCFAFSEIEGASQQDWAAFKKATEDLPKSMTGVVLHVWHGKLRRPLNQYRIDAVAGKKLTGGEKDVDGKINLVKHTYGVCMEMAGEESLKVYEKHPAHEAWVKVYEKVRVEGSTTYDILGQ